MNQQDPFLQQTLEKAECLKLDGAFEEAIELLQQIILHDPLCVETYEELGDNYLSLRELAKSRKALEYAVKINPDSANAHYLLGFLHSLEHRWGKSVICLQRADELFPNNAEILRCLGWSLYNENRKGQGVSLLERSQMLKPTDPNILCDLGVCYMNNSDFMKAENAFQKVIQLHPDSDQARECSGFLKMLKQVQ